MSSCPEPRPSAFYKDEVLWRLSNVANVAQFVSFDPALACRYSVVDGFQLGHHFSSPEEAAEVLAQRCPEATVNVRSFDPFDSRGKEFRYGQTSRDAALTARRLAADGLYVIINETVNTGDGGVSGVAHGDLLECAPNDTPRCVEKPGTLSTERGLGLKLLRRVYGFMPELDFPLETRVEWSIHPIRRGHRRQHTIVWEAEPGPAPPVNDSLPRWPNRFSTVCGDKVFGLLVAELLGFRVPASIVIGRQIPPFSFGQPAGTGETWIRTSPREQDPGRFTTHRGWLDPFHLIRDEDQDGDVAAVVAQEGVEAVFSGAVLTQDDGTPVIEGVPGTGEDLMLGRVGPQPLPARVRDAVRALFELLASKLGIVRFEWVFDGHQVWLVQLHRDRSGASTSVIVPGEAVHFVRFDVRLGLDELRRWIELVAASGRGIALVGEIGRTSHMCDALRRAQVPSYLTPA